MLPRLWLLVGSDRQTDRPTMSLIELSWTAKNISPLSWNLPPWEPSFASQAPRCIAAHIQTEIITNENIQLENIQAEDLSSWKYQLDLACVHHQEEIFWYRPSSPGRRIFPGCPGWEVSSCLNELHKLAKTFTIHAELSRILFREH